MVKLKLRTDPNDLLYIANEWFFFVQSSSVYISTNNHETNTTGNYNPRILYELQFFFQFTIIL